jgi:hypothetical protein
VKTVGEIRGHATRPLLSLQDLGKGSLAYLRKTLGLPSTEGVQPGSAKPPEREAELKANGK